MRFPVATQAIVALSTAGTAMVGTVVSYAVDNGASGVAPWLQFGGTGAAVGALAYIAKMFADGKLVAVPITEWQKAQAVQLAESLERERILAGLTQEAHDREQRFMTLLTNGMKGP